VSPDPAPQFFEVRSAFEITTAKRLWDFLGKKDATALRLAAKRLRVGGEELATNSSYRLDVVASAGIVKLTRKSCKINVTEEQPKKIQTDERRGSLRSKRRSLSPSSGWGQRCLVDPEPESIAYAVESILHDLGLAR
jgi:hypothetical protein